MKRRIAGIALALVVAILVVIVKQRFDASERRAAIAAVESFKPDGARTIADLIRARHPGAALDVAATDASSCFHHVRVTVLAGTTRYEFLVDLDVRQIAAANEEARAILALGPPPPR